MMHRKEKRSVSIAESDHFERNTHLAIITGKEFSDTTTGSILHVGYWVVVLGTITVLLSRTKLE
jgi:hypothetical protein